jgi:hypothetical protein
MRLVSSVNSVDLKTGLRVKEFTSPTTAATAIGISRLEISQCCRGLLDEAGGFGWEFASGKIFCNLCIHFF